MLLMDPCLKAPLEARRRDTTPTPTSQGRIRSTWIAAAMGYTRWERQSHGYQEARSLLQDSGRRPPRPGASGGRGTRYTNLYHTTLLGF